MELDTRAEGSNYTFKPYTHRQPEFQSQLQLSLGIYRDFGPGIHLHCWWFSKPYGVNSLDFQRFFTRFLRKEEG